MESSFPLEDTLYTAEQAQLWQCTRTSGVYSSEKDLIVKSVSGMRVSVSEGIAWLALERFKGIVYGNTEVMNFNIEQADGVLQRIDRIVVRYDYVTNKTLLKVKKGVFASSPVAPPVERVPGVAFEIVLADIFINRGAVSIIQSNITDKRLDETVCGVMSDGVTKIPTQLLVAQWESWFTNFKNTAQGDTIELTEWIFLFKQQANKDFLEWFAAFKLAKEAEFQAWFNTIKGLLGTDPAGVLAMNIMEIERALFTTKDIDNLLQFPNCKKIVDFSVSNRILTTVQDKTTALKVATSETIFNTANIQKILTLYESNGVLIARRETYTTTFDGDQMITV